ncbi:hypothetical protein [Paludibacterium purpuratum]|uniref:Uncharacterized protein n=1 Tax=Paludibacterium purpuratum TaxID=1144873 RepID=A0A4R7BBT3_9NEIS|nr:hypothetical protein [Paludibacterium purpuratum]TDR81562.1 hypothetical protein DFP86_103215 [Paludibacterium purpuratum]
MSVINLQPHSGDVNLGAISTQLHIYNTGKPSAETGHYDIKIGNNAWVLGVNIQTGHTDTYNPQGAVVLINNWGMTRLQALYGTLAMSPEEAGLETSTEDRDLSHIPK